MHSLTTGAVWRSTIVGALIGLTMHAAPVSAQSVSGPQDGLSGRPEYKQAEFEKYVSELGFGNTSGSMRYDGPLPCPDTTKCGSESSVEFSIIPSDYVDDWEGAVKGTKNGHIVAKIFKAELKPFGYWNLLEDDALSYLWIGKFKDGQGAALYARRNGKLKRIYTFSALKKCPKAEVPPGVHPRPTPECSDPIGMLPRDVRLASTSTGNFMAAFTERQGVAVSGLWVSCSGGCCEVQYAL